MSTASVVGSGPNGLTAALLARAGVEVTVFEAADDRRGTPTTERIAPGLLYDHCSAVHPVAVGSAALRSPNLQPRGLPFTRGGPAARRGTWSRYSRKFSCITSPGGVGWALPAFFLGIRSRSRVGERVHSPGLVCGAPLGGGFGFIEGAAVVEDLAAGGDAAGVDDRAGAGA
jgi:phytoene dehydrogenase-like protein